MIVLAHDSEAEALKRAGVIVQCASCANAGPLRSSMIDCKVFGTKQGAELWRICRVYEERTEAPARPRDRDA